MNLSMAPQAKGLHFGPKHLEQTILSYLHIMKQAKLSQGNTSPHQPPLSILPHMTMELAKGLVCRVDVWEGVKRDVRGEDIRLNAG